ncbi:ComEC/Rec2 family competence protein [Psychroserpens damuponensis]|uniref:ComEC/Rec2 family competence protein n=1 Tax=Psychroserpens damuponensis TaxID=943936 RepID=UPI000A05A384|nr:ComEC/Rec2 family competence protein [Psychroserpens damuponensis]
MKPLNTVIIKLTLCLIIGIVLCHYFTVSLIVISYCLLALFALLGICSYVLNRTFKKTIWFGCIAYILMICLGIYTYQTHNQLNFKKHYTTLHSTDVKDTKLIRLKIRERLKSSTYYDKYVVELIAINKASVNGKCLLNISKDSLNAAYTIDDVLITSTNFKSLPFPINPNQFNYKAYLEKQYIYHQLSVSDHDILKLKSPETTVYGLSDQLRQTINKKLNYYNFKPEELAIINALLLGQRQDLSQDLQQNYVNAGAIHILAVSGLHVGIILLILSHFLKPLERFRNGTVLKVIILITLLWSFALIAGLSASVTRAVTMFSIVSVALHWKRATNIYNTLAISVFILLLFKPLFLFDVGFQMSYLAVLAIVSLQPLLYNIWKPKWKAIDYFWKILTVTIAAQFGVVPISLYYFHQFPGLFFISNLAIIPFLGLILGIGILVIVLALCNILPQFLATIYGFIISVMNDIIKWVANQELYVLKHISFDITHVIAFYSLIIASIFMFKKQHFKPISFFLIAILLVQGAYMHSAFKNSNEAFIILHKSRYSMIFQKLNSELKISHNLDSMSLSKDKIITNYSVGNFITSSTLDTLQSVYQFHDRTLLIIDSLGVYNVKRFEPDYVLLRNSPKLNMNRVIDSINPKYIIADGSNYTSYVKRWKQTCLKRKLPFHYTKEKGAFIIK